MSKATCEPIEYPPIPRNTPACRQGRWAYADGKSFDDCPHQCGDSRIQWLAGWLDGQTAAKFPHLFN